MSLVARLRRALSNTRSASLTSTLRKQRFLRFVRLVNDSDASLGRLSTILDVGGTESFWEMMDFAESGYDITLLNTHPIETHHQGIRSVVGDARSLDLFADRQFDIVFSNSVIEHVGTLEQQRMMANEVRRVARRYFVQTPNFSFPIEPHFLFPGFQWLPREARVWLVRHAAIGWYERTPDLEAARAIVNEVRLLTRREIRMLFPDGEITSETFYGLTKSFMVVGPRSPAQGSA
jgi:Methyltransferase domain